MEQFIRLDYFVLFLIISLGLLLGHVRIRGIALDVSAVIFIALIFGHYGITLPPETQTIGLLLFIVTIGMQAGPGFFDAFRKRDLQLISTPLVVVLTGAVTTVALAYVMGVDFKLAVGLFTGALTSTPGLAAAIEATGSPLASIGYGIAYPFGIIVIVLFVRLAPRILKVDLRGAQQAYVRTISTQYPEIINKNFIVENVNIDGQSIETLSIRSMTGASISRVMHGGVAATPTPQTRIFRKDLIKAVGTSHALEKIKLLIGPVTQEEIPLSQGYEVQWIVVTNKKVINKSLSQLNLHSNYNATVTRIRRSEVEFAPQPHSQLRFGDKLMVACDTENMGQVAILLGNNNKRLSETDFLPLALGIVLGVLLGSFRLPLVAGFSLHLGLTGGVLTAALILSKLGKTGPVIWSLPSGGSTVLRQLGLLLFLASVGTEAGTHIQASIGQYGFSLVLIALLITLAPLLTGILVAVKLFRLNLLTALGALTGAMTSTPGLAAINDLSDCEAPQVAYATVYPIALVLKIICVQIIAVL